MRCGRGALHLALREVIATGPRGDREHESLEAPGLRPPAIAMSSSEYRARFSLFVGEVRVRGVISPALGPPTYVLKRVHPGGVLIVPRDVESPCAVESGIYDPQRRWAVRAGPRTLASAAKIATCCAWAGEAKFGQAEPGDVAIRERSCDPLIALHFQIDEFIAVIHKPSLPESSSVGVAPC